MINGGYSFTNNTSRTETFPVYCTVLECIELVGEVTLLPHTTMVVSEATCNVPRIMERHTPYGESGNG